VRTELLYLIDPYAREFAAVVVATDGAWCALDRTAFYPGGGGQPPDRGTVEIDGAPAVVEDVRADDDGRVWHRLDRATSAGAPVRGAIDWSWRHGLMRAHALMHVVNRVARDAFGGVITGVQLGPVRSRIDLKLASFGRDRLGELEALVHAVLARPLALSSSTISEQEFSARPELVRTLDVVPPVIDGRVRIVEIEGFDVQACGATHVRSLVEVGGARLTRFDNKGKDNKRFYWDLDDAP
jgi:misacylated tRNA(Ala) deacylase